MSWYLARNNTCPHLILFPFKTWLTILKMPTENSSWSVLSPYLCLELVGHGCDFYGDQSSNLVIWMMEFQGQGTVFGNILFTIKNVVPRTAPGLQYCLKQLQN